MMTTPTQTPLHHQRIRGVLLGLAVGDALGTTLEFTQPPASPWIPPLTGPHAAVTGGGPFHVVPGQVTDDTHMAICLARVLAADGGNRPPTPATLHDLATSYVTWRRQAFDVGRQTSAALSSYTRTGDPHTAGLQAWLATEGLAAGNGALMRAAVIGALVPDPLSRRCWAVADALITHADPRCILANVVFVQAIAAGVAGGDASAMVAAARAALIPAFKLAQTMVDLGPTAEARWDAAQSELRADLDAAGCSDPWLNGEVEFPGTWPLPLRQHAAESRERYRLGIVGEQAGFVRVAFRLAFWQLLHAHDWTSGLIDTVNRGGDADTNGAIVGALLGARFGGASIPEGWGQLVLTCDTPVPWNLAGLYHPQALLALVERS